jgi:hypothetical protein
VPLKQHGVKVVENKKIFVQIRGSSWRNLQTIPFYSYVISNCPSKHVKVYFTKAREIVNSSLIMDSELELKVCDPLRCNLIIRVSKTSHFSKNWFFSCA